MEKILLEHPWIIIFILVWTLPWKGVALWRAARNGHFRWFWALILINSLAILDIIYILFFSNPNVEEKPNQDEVRQARMQRYREQQSKKRALEEQVQQQEVSMRQPSSIAISRKRPTII